MGMGVGLQDLGRDGLPNLERWVDIKEFQPSDDTLCSISCGSLIATPLPPRHGRDPP